MSVAKKILQFAISKWCTRDFKAVFFIERYWLYLWKRPKMRAYILKEGPTRGPRNSKYIRRQSYVVSLESGYLQFSKRSQKMPCFCVWISNFLGNSLVAPHKKESHMTIDIQKITANLPEFLRPKDLIKCGLYKSPSDVSWAMKRGQAPPSIRLTSHKIVFPKVSLCDWLREKTLADEVAGVI